MTKRDPWSALVEGMSALFDADAKSILDVCWYARYIDTRPTESYTAPPALPIDTTGSIEEPVSALNPAEELTTLKTPPIQPRKALRNVRHTAARGGIFTNLAPSRNESSIPVTRIRIPAGTAVPHSLELVRAIRRLSGRPHSRTSFELDADATAEATAENRLMDNRLHFTPVLRARRERWFNAVLVVERTPSMEIWTRTLVDVERVLQYSGVFRDVRTEWLQFQPKAGLVRRDGALAPLNSLRDPTGRRLIILFSTGMSESWVDGTFGKAIESWGRTTSVAFLDLLPLDMWKQTTLGEPLAVATSPLFAAPNIALRSKVAWWAARLPVAGRRVPVPVFGLDPQSMQTWANMLNARRQTAAPAFLVRTEPRTAPKPPSPDADLVPEERVRRFQSNCSPQTFRLAAHLAVAPFTVPLIHLVQHALFKDDRSQREIAELMLSGLVERTTPLNESVPADQVTFRIHDDVAPILVNSLRIDSRKHLERLLQRTLDNPFGGAHDFWASMRDPNGILRISSASIPFAELRPSLFPRIRSRLGEAAPHPDMPVVAISSTADGNRVADLISERLREEGYESPLRYSARDVIRLRPDEASIVLVLLTPRYVQSAAWPEIKRIAQQRRGSGTEPFISFVRAVPGIFDGDLAALRVFDLTSALNQPADWTRKILRAALRVPKTRTGPRWPVIHPAIAASMGQNAAFIDRNNEVAALERGLHDRNVVAVLGEAGSGKSTLARYYAWTHRARYHVMWSLTASSEQQIVRDVLRLASIVEPELSRLVDRASAAHRVLDDLSVSGRSILFIAEDATDEAVLRRWMRPEFQVIATASVSTEWSNDISRVHVSKWDRDGAQRFLIAELGEARPISESDVAEIVDAVGFYPLALRLAAATLRRDPISASVYVGRFRTFVEAYARGGEEAVAVFGAVCVALSAGEERSPGVAALLCFASFFDSDAVAAALFQQEAHIYGGDLLPALIATDVDLRSTISNVSAHDDLFSTLEDLSLIVMSPDRQGFTAEPEVQQAARALCSPEEPWSETALCVLREILPKYDATTWPLYERYLPHAIIALRGSAYNSQAGAAVASRVGSYLYHRGDFIHGGELYHKAFTITEAAEGSGALATGDAAAAYALFLSDVGQYFDAEKYLNRALAIYEQHYDADHGVIAVALNNLAHILVETDAPSDARDVIDRALTIATAVYGEQDTKVASMLSTKALVLTNLGELVQAQQLLERAIEIERLARGDSDMALAGKLMQLAMVLVSLERREEARELNEQALHIAELHGHDNAATARVLVNLVKSLDHDDQRGIDLLSRALRTLRRSFGDSHPEIAEVLAMLAERQQRRGHVVEGLRLFEEAWRMDEPLLRPMHSLRTAILVPYVVALNALHERTASNALMSRWVAALSEVSNPRAAAKCAIDVAAALTERNAIEAADIAVQFALVVTETSPEAAEYRSAARRIADVVAARPPT